MDPFRIGHLAPQLPDFTYISPQRWQAAVAELYLPIPSHLGVRLVCVCRVRTKYMKSITLLVLYLQGYDAGRSSNFKFDVPLWNTVRPCLKISLVVPMDPLQNRTSCPAITRFHLYLPQNLTGCCGWATKYMKSITLLVLYLQGYDAGQKCLKISINFKFDVPLWLTRIRLDLVIVALL